MPDLDQEKKEVDQEEYVLWDPPVLYNCWGQSEGPGMESMAVEGKAETEMQWEIHQGIMALIIQQMQMLQRITELSA